MKSMRKFAAIAAATMMTVTMGACASERPSDTPAAPAVTEEVTDVVTDVVEGETPAGTPVAAGDALVGISMPTRSLERWNNDGANLEQQLQAQGFRTSLQYADNRVDQQISQIQNMINDGAKVLVVAAIDGTALGPTLQTAADQGIRVLAYDRLINDTENVDYYATFDNEAVGKMQGDFIIDQLGLADGATGPFNIEMLAGSPDDNNAYFFFCGAFTELKPYLDSGVLVSPSGKVPASCDQWTELGIQGWSSATAQNEMENRLNSFYGGGERVDVVLSPNDSLALGITQALLGAGYTAADFPILTGQDADVANVQNIIDGTQSMTVWKDTRTLADQASTMVGQMVNGETVAVNDTETYNNGVKIVPTYLLPLELVTKDNIQTKLIDSGFLAADAVHGL